MAPARMAQRNDILGRHTGGALLSHQRNIAVD